MLFLCCSYVDVVRCSYSSATPDGGGGYPTAPRTGIHHSHQELMRVIREELKMGKDTDGTNWMTVRYTVDIQVMAETADEAFYFANLKLPDYSLENYFAEIVEED